MGDQQRPTIFNVHDPKLWPDPKNISLS